MHRSERNISAFDRRDLRATAALLVTFVALSLTAYAGLMVTFGFPDILRAPAAEILAAFDARRTEVRGFYYLFAVAHLIFAAAVIVLARALRAADGPWLAVATAGGVLYGLAQTMGFLRWPILVPVFADYLGQADLSPDARAAGLLMLDAFHHYAGNAIGENLSFWGLAVWLTGVGAALQHPKVGHRTTGLFWMVAGFLVFVYTFEQLGGPFAVLGPVLLISHGLAYGLILLLAWTCVKTTDETGPLAPAGAVATTAVVLFCGGILVPGMLN